MKSKILIIEDNKDVRENLSELLSLSGYDTVTAANGKEGVQAAMRDSPDLILCDVMMPELDGYGVLRILSKNPGSMHIPFIFLTAKTELADVRRGMTLGADDYITKPYDDVELLDTLEMRLSKKKAASQAETHGGSLINLLTDKQLYEALPKHFKEGESRLIRKKDLLYAEGQTCRNVFLLRSGRAISSKIDDYSKEVITHLYKSPMIIGVSSAFSGQRYRETVKVFEDLEVIPVKTDEFIHFTLSHPGAAFYFLHQLANDQLKADEKLLLQAFGSVRMKLASTLIDLYASYEKNTKATLSISREDLANMAGTAKETIIRCLTEFKEEGLIGIQGSDIIIDSIHKLVELRY
jgi:DNA-binding response OmpR family regulator